MLVNLGHGRGMLEQEAAESVWRMDAQLGRPVSIQSAWRDPFEQAQLRADWLAYERFLNGGPWAPWAPYALDPDESWHCKGWAIDTAERGEWLDANGWIQTNSSEAWHRDRYRQFDQHLNDSTPAPPTTRKDADTMRAVELEGAVDSGIIIQDGCLPSSLPRQVFDALCGSYGLTSVVLPDWKYGTVVREQWSVFTQNHPAVKVDVDDINLDDDDLDRLAGNVAAQVRAGVPLAWKVIPA